MTGARRPADAWLRVLSLLGCLVAWQLIAQTERLPLLPTPAVVLTSLWVLSKFTLLNQAERLGLFATVWLGATLVWLVVSLMFLMLATISFLLDRLLFLLTRRALMWKEASQR